MENNKLNYATEIANEINATTAYTAEAKEVTKNNGIKLVGIQITELGSNISPIIYVDQFIELGTSAEDAAEQVVQIYLANADKNFDLSSLEDWSKAKEVVTPRLIGINNDVSDFPHKTFCDLYIIYAIQVSKDGAAKVTNQMLDRWGITLDELDRVARENMKPTMMTMAEMLASLGFPMEEVSDMPMYVITNKSKIYGASSILSTEIIDRFDQDMYILPSSVHELIAVPAGDLMAMELGNMIKEINQNEVLPEEVLGDDPYFFEYATKEIRMVAA